METTVPIAVALAAAFLLALGAVADDRRARVRRRAAIDPVADPPLLHSINDDRCIGCEACIDVCPTEVLELVDHKARVVRFSDCVQCEQCANSCPTTALVMYREGHAPTTLTVPELDEHFQTGVPGQYLIGEVAGKPLVKNAANLGRAVIEHLAKTLGPHGEHGVHDVVIVGSGPGGLSAGLACLHAKLSCLVLEKEHVLASTVSRYPKGKLFMAEPANDRNVSFLPVFDANKEELVAAWQKVVDAVKLPVRLGEAVESVARGADGIFTVKTTVDTYRARAVVLATGLRGKPRLLAVPGANLEKVKSRLDDPDEFARCDVLVVGGGDSAVEAAMSLADAGCTVTLSYRGDSFKRCKQGNQKRLADMVAEHRVSVLLESNVEQFTEDAVAIRCKDGRVATIPNQHAFVLIGADTPVAWLEANNVRFVEREHLYALGSTEEVVRRIAANVVECSKSPDEAIANLLGKKPQRRLRSVVHHIHDEFRDVLTSVTGVFRISDIEKGTGTGIRAIKQGGTRTAVKPVRHATQAGDRRTASNLIPPKDLARPRRPSPPPPLPRLLTPPPIPAPRRPTQNPFDPEPTVSLSAYGRPAPRHKPEPVQHDTMEDTLSLPARLAARQLGQVIAQRASNPFDNDPTTLGGDTVARADDVATVTSSAGWDDELDAAFGRLAPRVPNDTIPTPAVTNETGPTVAMPTGQPARGSTRTPAPAPTRKAVALPPPIPARPARPAAPRSAPGMQTVEPARRVFPAEPTSTSTSAYTPRPGRFPRGTSIREDE